MAASITLAVSPPEFINELTMHYPGLKSETFWETP